MGNSQDARISHDSETVQDARSSTNLWYRILVLLYDLNNVSYDPLSDKRISSTTDVLYISPPYFSESEAARIRSTLANCAAQDYLTDSTADYGLPQEDQAPSTEDVPRQATVEEAIHEQLFGFLDKHRASGDARPCGPYTLFPIYASVFGIKKEEVKGRTFSGSFKEVRAW